MSRYQRDHTGQLRRQLAQLAARIMAEEELADFHLAKRKAASRMGVDVRKLLPSNVEIEAELRAYRALFQGEEHAAHLRRLREAAREAMRFFAAFRPLLVGPVLEGTAGERGVVSLHLYVDTPEALGLFLLEQGIPHELAEVSLRMAGGRRSFPAVHFMAGDVAMELVMLPAEGGRQPPLSPVDGRPMKRASLRQLEALLGTEPPSG